MEPRLNLTRLLLNWYAQCQRSLPWRETNDPYAIWVAEVMLQQTRVETVLPYYRHWLQRFPTIQSLAEASQEQVLSLWEGLGYYSRARNLHKAAQLVMDQYGGQLPANWDDLERLPGIGKAGAADILSISFGQDYASVDGNIRRVIARIFEIDSIPGSGEFESTVQEIVTQHLPPGQAGDYNQAWMDLGASICLPADPRCGDCPIQSECQAFHNQTQLTYPRKKTKASIPVQISVAVVFIKFINESTQVLLYQRPQTGLLAGLWAFPNIDVQQTEDLQSGLSGLMYSFTGQIDLPGALLGQFHHTYTHFKSIVHAYTIQLDESVPLDLNYASSPRWVELTDLSSFPMGKVDRLIAQKAQSKHPKFH